MVQPRVEWSIVGSAVRRSVIGLRVSYISSLSLSRRRKNTQALPTDCPRIENNNGREEHGVSWLLGFLLVTQPSRPLSALFALCRVSNPPTLLSTTTREMVIRYGLEVAWDLLVERHGSSFFISITVSHVSPPCRLFDTWNMSEEVLYEVCISLLCNCVNFQYSRGTGLVELVDGDRSLYLIIGSIQEFNWNTIFFIVRKKLIVHQFFKYS